LYLCNNARTREIEQATNALRACAPHARVDGAAHRWQFWRSPYRV